MLSTDQGDEFDLNCSDQMGYVRFTFPNPITVERLRFKITEVYKGWKYDDTAVCEVSFE